MSGGSAWIATCESAPVTLFGADMLTCSFLLLSCYCLTRRAWPSRTIRAIASYRHISLSRAIHSPPTATPLPCVVAGRTKPCA